MVESTNPEIIEISSEEVAWDIFNKALNDEIGNDVELVFDRWPVVSITLKGEDFQSSLTARNMGGLIEFQKSVYRTYALLVYNSNNINRLTDAEKQQLTIHFNISEGSSEAWAYLKNQLTFLSKDMASKLEPKHYVIMVLGAGLLIAGTVAHRDWLQNQKDMFIAEQATLQKQIEVEDRQFASQKEIERMEILASAFKVAPTLERVQETVDESRNIITHSMTDAEEVSMQGVESIKTETLQTILKKPRKHSIDDKTTGIYRIIKVDNSNLDHFRFFIRDINEGIEFWAIIDNDTISNKRMRTVLQNAEYTRQPVLLHVEVKRKAGNIVNAKILKAESPAEELLAMVEKGVTDIRIEYNYNTGFIPLLPEK